MNEILWLLLFWWIGTRILQAGRNRRKKNAAVPSKSAGGVEHLIAALLAYIKKQAAGRGAESLSQPAPLARDAVVDQYDDAGAQSLFAQERREKEVAPLVESVAVVPAISTQRKISLQQAVVWSEILAPPIALREK